VLKPGSFDSIVFIVLRIVETNSKAAFIHLILPVDWYINTVIEKKSPL
jgi:hypothetical protein